MRLDVLMEGQIAGSLDLSDVSRPVFAYDTSYLEKSHATPLSTSYPLDDRPIGDVSLRNWLTGVLPDDERVLRSLCEDHDVSAADRLALLGTPMGAECAGAVQFCPPDETARLVAGEGGLQELSDDEVIDWLRRLRNDPAYRPDLALVSAGFSLAGMQPKIALRLEDDRWHVPWGAEPSNRIIKITRHGAYPHEAVMEHLTMRTAARMGITTAQTEVISVEDVEAIIVTRYDRARLGESSLRRVHQEDFCQALGVSPNMKYQFQGGPTPADIARLLRRVDASGTVMLERFLDMLVFQWLIVGNDAHSKNYALLLSGDDCLPAPLYDACSWIPFRRESISKQRTAMKIGSNYRISSADQPSAMGHTAKRLGLPEPATIERFESLAAAMPDALEDAINHLPGNMADLPIVVNYAIEQRSRANRCETIANEAAKAARPRRSANPHSGGGDGLSLAPVVEDLSSHERRSRAKNPNRSRPRCTHIGKRSKKRCTLPSRHRGKHRYS